MPVIIRDVIYRKDNTVKRLALSDITKKSYREVYKGNLYCPNSNCSARIVYASGDKIAPYFKTWKVSLNGEEIKDEHISDCPYSVEHELEERLRRRTDSSFLTSLSTSHIRSILKNAYKKYYNIEEDASDDGKGTSKGKRKSGKSKSDPDKKPVGVAGLKSDGATEATEREPSVYRKSIDDVVLKDYNSVLCITGLVDNIEIHSNYAFIHLKEKNNKRTRVLFNEAFAVSPENQAMFSNFNILVKYFDYLTSNSLDVLCCCVGKITKDDYEVSVVPDSWIDFTINDKSYYGIISELEKIG